MIRATSARNITMDRNWNARWRWRIISNINVAVWACAVTLWKGVCRYAKLLGSPSDDYLHTSGGEFLIPSQNKFDSKYHVIRDTRIRWSKLATGLEWVGINIPWTKTTHEKDALIVLTACDEVTNPIPPLRHHLESTPRCPTMHHSLYSKRTVDGHTQPRTGSWADLEGS
jgi:hypothetical protein